MAVIEALNSTYLEADLDEFGITFSSIPQTYERLQLRGNFKIILHTSGDNDLTMRFNGVTSTSYSPWRAAGRGSSLYNAGYANWNRMIGGTVSGNHPDNRDPYYHSFIMDMFDYANTDKNTQCTLAWTKASPANPSMGVGGNLWAAKTGVTSINVYSSGNVHYRGGYLALYGINSS